MRSTSRRDSIRGDLARRVLRWSWLSGLLLLGAVHSALADSPSTLSFGSEAVTLSTPWRFHAGDDLRWADPKFDDASWEVMDLTAQPGAHDGDVGLTGYAPGWAARGHRGYKGYAWYRMTVRVADAGGAALWLAGPALVDDAYQLYFNGLLLGGIGDFARKPPDIFASQPRLFALPRALWSGEGGTLQGLIAVRVACILCGGADSGGMHIAPILGTEAGVRERYRLQWVEKVEGYLVDAAEPVFFVLLAALALVGLAFAPAERFSLWIAAALLLLALARLNQPLFWLGSFETLREFAFWRLGVVDGLTLGAWVMAWRAAYRLDEVRWLGIAAAALSALYVIARVLGTAVVWPQLPQAVVGAFAAVLRFDRLGFVALLVAVVALGQHRAKRTSWALPASIALGSIGLFTPELSQIGVPGIWFPCGVGVSRTEYAYAGMIIVLAIYLVQRLWRFRSTPARLPLTAIP